MIRMIALIAAAGTWARALAGPIALAVVGFGLFVLALGFGIDRTWPGALAGAVLAGMAAVWAGLRLTGARSHAAMTDGEGESL